jgi:hypothetical protein
MHRSFCLTVTRLTRRKTRPVDGRVLPTSRRRPTPLGGAGRRVVEWDRETLSFPTSVNVSGRVSDKPHSGQVIASFSVRSFRVAVLLIDGFNRMPLIDVRRAWKRRA